LDFTDICFSLFEIEQSMGPRPIVSCL